MDATKSCEFIGIGAMDATKPYEFIRFGAMYATKPYEFIRFGAMYATKPYEFIGFGAPGLGVMARCPALGRFGPTADGRHAKGGADSGGSRAKSATSCSSVLRSCSAVPTPSSNHAQKQKL